MQKVRQINVQRQRLAPQRRFTGKSANAPELAANPALELDYIVAMPRMARYIEVSSQIYGIYLKYVSPDDIHVYSIDEVFIDATSCLKLYKLSAHDFTMKLIREVLASTGFTATAGIGTNLYLAKIAMDIVAKHIPADRDGVRIAELGEQSYREKLWSHRTLTDFWRVGHGYAARLESMGMHTMGDVARMSIKCEEVLYRAFGVNAELLIDHAWGWEPVTIAEIKAYKPENNSMSSGQVLQEPYEFEKGRQVQKEAHGSVNLERFTSSGRIITEAMMGLFNRCVDPNLLARRITVAANHIISENDIPADADADQPDLFTDHEALEKQKAEEQAELDKEKRLQQAIIGIKNRMGKNAILKSTNYVEGATGKERNEQIGGHRK